MLKEIDCTRTVGELVVEHPALADVFETLGVDYCCGGKQVLNKACLKLGLSVDEMKKKLEEELAKSGTKVDAPKEEDSFASIIEHLLKVYHEPTKELLSQVLEQSEKVARVHGDKNEKLEPLKLKVQLLANDLLPHMEKEEKVLFPYLLLLDEASSVPEMHCGTVANPISVMEREHDEAGTLLAQIRELADDFVPPEWACNTYRVLLTRLESLEKETHKHIHLENNLLFPKTLTKIKLLS